MNTRSQTLATETDLTAKKIFASSLVQAPIPGLSPNLTGTWPGTLHDLENYLNTLPHFSPFTTISPLPDSQLVAMAMPEYELTFERRAFLAERATRITARSPRRIVIVHQPLFFPALGVVSILFLLAYLQIRFQDEAQVYFVVNDYDSIEERGFRSTTLPHLDDPSKEQLLTLPVYGAHRLTLITACPKYRSSDYKRLLSQLRGRPSPSSFVDTFHRVASSTHTLKELNVSLLIELINIQLKSPILFLSGFVLQQVARPAYGAVLRDTYLNFHRLGNEALAYLRAHGVQLIHYKKPFDTTQLPFWLVCAQCLARTAVKSTGQVFHATCDVCQRTVFSGTLDELAKNHALLLPRATCQNLVFPDLLGTNLIVSYNGAAEYALVANYIAGRLGRTTHPFYLLRLYPYYWGVSQLHASKLAAAPLSATALPAYLPAFRGFREARLSSLDLLLNWSAEESFQMFVSALLEANSLEAPLIFRSQSDSFTVAALHDLARQHTDSPSSTK